MKNIQLYTLLTLVSTIYKWYALKRFTIVWLIIKSNIRKKENRYFCLKTWIGGTYLMLTIKYFLGYILIWNHNHMLGWVEHAWVQHGRVALWWYCHQYYMFEERSDSTDIRCPRRAGESVLTYLYMSCWCKLLQVVFPTGFWVLLLLVWALIRF